VSNATWTTTAPGTVSPTTGSQTVFTASQTSTGTGSVNAAVNSVAGSASVSVVTLKQMNATVARGATYMTGINYNVPLTVTATDAGTGSAISGASMSLQVASGSCSGSVVASTSATTNANGQAQFTFKTKTAGSYCALATVNSSGYSQGSQSLLFSVP
jgi:hypothetical protein